MTSDNSWSAFMTSLNLFLDQSASNEITCKTLGNLTLCDLVLNLTFSDERSGKEEQF